MILHVCENIRKPEALAVFAALKYLVSNATPNIKEILLFVFIVHSHTIICRFTHCRYSSRDREQKAT